MSTPLDPRSNKILADHTTANNIADDHMTNAHIANAHITDEQIDDLLIGDLAPQPAAHLATCDLCAARVAHASSTLSSFHDVTLAWSERRSSTLPLPKPTPEIPLLQRQISWIATTFVLFLGLALLNTTHQLSLRSTGVDSIQRPSDSPETPAAPTLQAVSQPDVPSRQAFQAPSTEPGTSPVASPSTARPSQISADNQILEAVDNELDASVYTPSAFGIEPVRTHTEPSAITTLQD